MQRKIWICPPFRVHLLLSKLSSFNICISAMLYVAKTPPLIWNILGFLCWLSYNSVTIWLSNKEYLELLLLCISSSQQCNGNVMVNLTQNVRLCPISLPLRSVKTNLKRTQRPPAAWRIGKTMLCSNRARINTHLIFVVFLHPNAQNCINCSLSHNLRQFFAPSKDVYIYNIEIK